MPCVADLAALRAAVARLGGDPQAVNPKVPVDLVIDHSVHRRRLRQRRRIRPQRRARVRAQRRALRVPALGPDGLRPLPRRAAGGRHRPPGEPRVPRERRVSRTGRTSSYPDTLLGTDSHTTMIGGLGVLGWGVGGIEAEAGMLGEPIGDARRRSWSASDSTVRCPKASTATDLVLAITEMLARARRRREVRRVLRPRASRRSRSPTARRSRTCRRSTARPKASSRSTSRRSSYLRNSGRATNSSSSSRRTRRRRASSTTRTRPTPSTTRTLTFDLGSLATVAGRAEPSARPRRAARRRRTDSAASSIASVVRAAARDPPQGCRARPDPHDGADERHDRRAARRFGRHRRDHELHEHLEPERDGRRRPARTQRGREGTRREPTVKTSLAPGSPVVIDYLTQCRPDRAARGARLPPRRLRMHDVHRELRSAPRSDRRSHRRAQADDRRRSVREQELRRTHPPTGEGVVPRITAARRRVCARRDGRHRPHERSDRHGPRRRTTCSSATSGRAATRSRRPSRRRWTASPSSSGIGEIFDGDERWNALPVPDG